MDISGLIVTVALLAGLIAVCLLPVRADSAEDRGDGRTAVIIPGYLRTPAHRPRTWAFVAISAVLGLIFLRFAVQRFALFFRPRILRRSGLPLYRRGGVRLRSSFSRRRCRHRGQQGKNWRKTGEGPRQIFLRRKTQGTSPKQAFIAAFQHLLYQESQISKPTIQPSRTTNNHPRTGNYL